MAVSNDSQAMLTDSRRTGVARQAPRAFAALLVLAAAGCYHYVEMSPPQVTPGADVRVYAERVGNEVFRGLDGGGDVFLDGRWVEFRDHEIVLSVAGDEIREGLQTRTLRRRVVVEPDRLHRVEVRQLDRVRTGAVMAGLGAGLVWFIRSTFRVDEPGTPGRPPQNGEL